MGKVGMTRWTREELNTIGATLEVDLAARRRDGTLRTPVPVWIVRVGDDLYIRSWRGTNGAWFRAAQASHEGLIRTAGIEREIAFVVETDPGINDLIDDAYRVKYRHSSYLLPMIGAEARATTLRLVPR
jgi:hypothetical protein